jgi:hypothetical protein
MTSRAGNWMIAAGVVLALGGLCFLPAALSEGSDSSLLALGAALFSLGALGMSGGVYLKAQAVQAKPGGGETTNAAESNGRRLRGACDLCREDTPMVHCKVHQFHLCGGCLAEHYDFRSCVYVPSTRRAEGRASKTMAGKSMAARSGA